MSRRASWVPTRRGIFSGLSAPSRGKMGSRSYSRARGLATAPRDRVNLLHDVLRGHRAPDRGSFQFLGKEPAATDRRQRVEAGVSFVSPPHARDQSLGNFTVEENLILGQTRRGPFARRGWLKFESIRGNAVRSLSDFEVPDAKPRDRVVHLSLGAQQRIVIAREVL